MNPLFFGASERPLFGVYHPPATAQATASGVLLCPPYALEYMRTHWALRQLALKLTRAGHHVFRFDYAGTGDSAGERGQFDVGAWHDDIRAAAEEFMGSAGIARVSAVGVRLGGLLAATCSRLEIDELVLWDPVIDGADYVTALDTMHRKMLTDLDRFHKPRPANELNTKDQLLGFPFPQRTRDSIAALSLANDWKCDAQRVFLISSQTTGPADLAGPGLKPGPEISHETAAEEGNWNALKRIEMALFAPRTLSRIVEIIGAAS